MLDNMMEIVKVFCKDEVKRSKALFRTCFAAEVGRPIFVFVNILSKN